MLKANEIAIDLHFHNYKLLKDKKINLSGSYIYFIQGSNKVGKTSFKEGIATLEKAKNTTKEIVSRGEKDGFIEGNQIPGADGKLYTVHFAFEIGKPDKFIVTNDKGKRISNVTEIREIFKYTHITATEFLSKSLNAKGRKEQQAYILNFLTTEEREEFDKQKDIELVKYEDRTTAKTTLDTYTKQCEAGDISEEDKDKLKLEEEVKKQITDLRVQLEEVNKVSGQVTLLNKAKDEMISGFTLIKDNLITLLDAENVANSLSKIEVAITEQYDTELKELPSEDPIDIKARLTNGEALETEINIIKGKQQTGTDAIKKRDEAQKTWEKLDLEVKAARGTQKLIISNSDIPIDNLEVSDEGITIDGFSFKEDQICMSDAIKVVANLMCKINQAPIMLMGDASQLDEASLKEMYQIAEENNKVMIFDEVIREDTDLVVVGYDKLYEVPKSKPKKKAEKKNKSELGPSVTMLNQEEVKKEPKEDIPEKKNETPNLLF